MADLHSAFESFLPISTFKFYAPFGHLRETLCALVRIIMIVAPTYLVNNPFNSYFSIFHQNRIEKTRNLHLLSFPHRVGAEYFPWG